MVTRMDLDGAGSPSSLVTKILQAQPDMPIPVPIDDLAYQLDIVEIGELTTDGLEGVLVTDVGRSKGFILVSAGASVPRRRFTIGHEVGHFLMTHHAVTKDGFSCSRSDMARSRSSTMTASTKMEVEANEFAALLLMPPPILSKAMSGLGDPDLDQVTELARRFAVSKEAAARSIAQYHDEQVAIAVVKDGIILRVYRNRTRFPFMSVTSGEAVPRTSIFHRTPHAPGQKSILAETNAGQWLASDYGTRLPPLYEQVAIQQGGFAMILLWTETLEEEDDGEDNRTSKERYRDRQSAWAGRR